MSKATRLMICAPFLLSATISILGCDGGSSEKTEVTKPAMTQDEQKAEQQKREQLYKDNAKKGQR